MMQKEVAQRLTAAARTKEYGILSIAAQFAGKVKILFHVNPGSFFPKPNVMSSVVAFDFTASSRRSEYNTIRKLVRAAFGQRRKMLSNALQQYVTEQYNKSWQSLAATDSKVAEYGHKRAEELAPDDFLLLHKHLEIAYGVA
jgi:16S rRNA (adenine1518-N6/adenine1519-N6)-dimethyltransferase